MLAVRVPSRCKAAAGDLLQYMLHLGLRQHGLAERLDVAHVAAADGDVVGHFGLEYGAAGEGHQRMDGIWRYVEQAFQRFHVLVVLAQRVLELEALAVELLGPLGLAFVAEDPTRHVLGLDDEDAVAGDQHVVDLRGAVGRRQRNVVNSPVLLRRQPHPGDQLDEGFAEHALEPTGLEHAQEHDEGQHPP